MAEPPRRSAGARGWLGSPILAQIDPANALTLVGLLLGLASVAESIAWQFGPAMIALIWAGVADLFDGFVARRLTRTQLQADVGRHLDSLVDAVSFGVAPVVLVYCSGPAGSPLDLLLGGAYLCCVVLRLAYFDAVGLTSDGDRESFTGLPVTYAALLFPLWGGCLEVVGRPSHDALALLLAGSGLAMVSSWQVRKPKGRWYAVFAVLAVALTVAFARLGSGVTWH